MSNLQIFDNAEFGNIRMVMVDGKPHAVAIDVARMLGYKNTNDAIIRHCKGVVKFDAPTTYGVQTFNVIPKGDIYRLIVKAADQSNNLEIKAKAEKFERWIFDEVIPSIEQHGAYLTLEKAEEILLSPDTIINLARQIKEKNEQIQQLTVEVEQAKPLVLFAKTVSASEDSINVGTMAKIIKQKGYDIGEKRLYEWLRKNGYCMKKKKGKNVPTQKAIELGVLEIKETTTVSAAGKSNTNITPMVTGKGQLYFVNIFLKQKDIDNAN